MKATAIVLMLVGLVGFVSMDVCHVVADKHDIDSATALLCQMSSGVAVGGIVLGILLGAVDLVRKSRRG
jgi:hypothetical protein